MACRVTNRTNMSTDQWLGWRATALQSSLGPWWVYVSVIRHITKTVWCSCASKQQFNSFCDNALMQNAELTAYLKSSHWNEYKSHESVAASPKGPKYNISIMLVLTRKKAFYDIVLIQNTYASNNILKYNVKDVVHPVEFIATPSHEDSKTNDNAYTTLNACQYCYVVCLHMLMHQLCSNILFLKHVLNPRPAGPMWFNMPFNDGRESLKFLISL